MSSLYPHVASLIPYQVEESGCISRNVTRVSELSMSVVLQILTLVMSHWTAAVYYRAQPTVSTLVLCYDHSVGEEE